MSRGPWAIVCRCGDGCRGDWIGRADPPMAPGMISGGLLGGYQFGKRSRRIVFDRYAMAAAVLVALSTELHTDYLRIETVRVRT